MATLSRFWSRNSWRRRKSVVGRRRKLSLGKILRFEQLEARELMHANAVLSAEHLAVFGSVDPNTQAVVGGLAPDSAVSYRSMASGEWDDPATWLHVGSPGDGTIPGNDANVVITAGTTVTIDSDLSVNGQGQRVAIRTIRDDGTLRFDPHQDTKLLADTILVRSTGVFEMGTEAEPIDANRRARVIFADRELGMDAAAQAAFEADRRAWDPLQFSLGLVSHGEIDIHGSHVTSFVQGGLVAMPGATSLQLAANAPGDWKVGDRLIVTGGTPTDAAGKNQDDEVLIAGINGKVLSFSPTTPLKSPHAPMATYVANVSRNATFESETPCIATRRGHVMFMHSDEVEVESAGFYGLGRTDKRRVIDDAVNSSAPDNPGQMTTDVLLKDINANNPVLGHRVMTPVVDSEGKQVIDPATGQPKLQIARTGLNLRGRYAVHFHRTGLTPGESTAVIDNSTVVVSPGWGIVNHSSRVDVLDNVVFNALGAAFVTEAGDELGRFDHNLAVHSRGSGEQIESRRAIQDFGHEGSGFWLQGGNVSLTNNIASGQRHSGFVFFPRGLDQKGLGVTTIAGANLAYPWAEPTKQYEVADVPLLEFKGNITFGVQTGFESWFTLLHAGHSSRSVLEDFLVFSTTSTGIFIPYTNNMTLKNVTLKGNKTYPANTAIDRNSITQNIVYDHVHAQGWAVGIEAPLIGVSTIVGGTFNNLKNINVTTTNARTRVLNINDAGPTDPVIFIDNLTTVVNGVAVPRKQFDIFLETNFQPLHNDLTLNFNPDVIQMGLVSHNGQQVYYLEQAADFTPFPSTQQADRTKFGPMAASFVPTALQDKTNAKLWAAYGLAIGGIVAPADAVKEPMINGLVGGKATYPPDITTWGKKYYNDSKGDFKLIFAYFNTTTNKYEYVAESQHTPLAQGWNLLTRQLNGQTRTILMYGDNIPPVLEFSASMPTKLNKADLDNGTQFVVTADIVDDSFGKMHFNMTLKLNDAKYVSALKTRADGTQFVTISFSIQDFAGNVSIIHLDMDVTLTAPLIKDINQKLLPNIQPSQTLLWLLAQ